MSTDPLALDAETMRRIGYRTVDMLVDELTDRTAPPLRRGDPEELARRLGGPPPEEPEPFDALLERLRTEVLPFGARVFHPGFFGFVPGSGTWPGALGDLVAAALNIHAGAWMVSAGPSRLELDVLGWFKDWVGYPPEAGGVAGERRLGGEHDGAGLRPRGASSGAMTHGVVAYVADQAHSSVAARRAHPRLPARPGARAAGRRATSGCVRGLLAGAIDADRAAGRRPLFVIASGGTTNTGAVDPLPRSPRSAASAASGCTSTRPTAGFAALTDRGRDGARRDRAGRLDHARPAQVALPAVRVRLRAGPRRRGAAARRSR